MKNMSSSNITQKLKHRACDECRKRKLACSKDPAGCNRCKRENVDCHYSEQKPMGRPRKRQFIEREIADASNEVDHVPELELAQPYFIDDLDLYDGLDNFLDPLFSTSIRNAPVSSTKVRDSHRILNFEERQIVDGSPISFGDLSMQVFPLTDVGIPASFPKPDLSPASNESSIESENSPPRITALAPCGCLSAMYLSLAALQQFPSDIATALKTVRGGAATASDCVLCPQCGSVALNDLTPPIELFQNTMLLGTIIPIVANGYARLLKMIDEETNIAIAAGQNKTFRFQDYGGFFESQHKLGPKCPCDAGSISFNSVEMPAQEWRRTVCALLRIDVHGYEQGGLKHKGLKDLITDLEIRQTIRHDMIDSIRAGSHAQGMTGHGFFRTKDGKCIDSETRGCMHMLQMARIAIDNLVIP